MLTSEVLDLAADLIEERGWVTGNEGWGYGGEAVGLCLEGAIGAAAGIAANQTELQWGVAPTGAINHCPAGMAVRDYLGLLEDRFLWKWNDEQTSAAPVIATLRAVSAVVSARESQPATVSA